MKEYKRTCEDELDWVVVDQLHKATLQMSNNCFEFKKICVGLIGAVLAILVKLNDNQLTHSYFFYSTTYMCWFLDCRFFCILFSKKNTI